MILPITLTIAGAAALLHLWLSFRVSQLRVRHRISIGDEDHLGVRTRMRAHANFAENAPLALLLLALLEMAGTSAVFLWIAGIAFVIARIVHAFGMDRPSPNPLRMSGILLSWLVLLVLAGYAIAVPYTERQGPPPITFTGIPAVPG